LPKKHKGRKNEHTKVAPAPPEISQPSARCAVSLRDSGRRDEQQQDHEHHESAHRKKLSARWRRVLESTGRLADLAEARGMSKADLRSAYLSGLEVYGERVENRIEEFIPWLKRFQMEVAGDDTRTRFDAWQKLKLKCDFLLLVRNLYLFTYPKDAQHAKKKTTADVQKDSCRFLKEVLDKLIPRYATLHKRTSKLCADPKLKLVSVLSEEASALFSELLNLTNKLKNMRRWAAKMASLKTDARDIYLYSMAVSLRESTGEYQMSDLQTLIEAALAAHGQPHKDVVDAENLKRHVQRFVKRMNLPRYESGAGKKKK
jgi:hypothetical protein